MRTSRPRRRGDASVSSSVRPGPTIKEGMLLPSVKFAIAGEHLTMREFFTGKRAILFGGPGAFHPEFTSEVLQTYVARAACLRAHVNFIGCLCVNDRHVVKAWAKCAGAKNDITFLSDVRGQLVNALGLQPRLSADGSCRQFAMLVNSNAEVVLLKLDRECSADFICRHFNVHLDLPDASDSNSIALGRAEFDEIRLKESFKEMVRTGQSRRFLECGTESRELDDVNVSDGTRPPEAREEESGPRLVTSAPLSEEAIIRKKMEQEVPYHFTHWAVLSARREPIESIAKYTLTCDPMNDDSVLVDYCSTPMHYVVINAGNLLQVECAATSDLEKLGRITLYEKGRQEICHAVNFNFNSPSSHNLGGVIAPIDLKIVHSKASNPRHFAIICIPFVRHPEDKEHEMLESVLGIPTLSNCREIFTMGSGILPDAQFPLNSLFTRESKFHVYNSVVGGFGICVQWLVAAEPLPISTRQIWKMKELLGDVTSEMYTGLPDIVSMGFSDSVLKLVPVELVDNAAEGAHTQKEKERRERVQAETLFQLARTLQDISSMSRVTLSSFANFLQDCAGSIVRHDHDIFDDEERLVLTAPDAHLSPDDVALGLVSASNYLKTMATEYALIAHITTRVSLLYPDPAVDLREVLHRNISTNISKMYHGEWWDCDRAKGPDELETNIQYQEYFERFLYALWCRRTGHPFKEPLDIEQQMKRLKSVTSVVLQSRPDSSRSDLSISPYSSRDDLTDEARSDSVLSDALQPSHCSSHSSSTDSEEASETSTVTRDVFASRDQRDLAFYMLEKLEEIANSFETCSFDEATLANTQQNAVRPGIARQVSTLAQCIVKKKTCAKGITFNLQEDICQYGNVSRSLSVLDDDTLVLTTTQKLNLEYLSSQSSIHSHIDSHRSSNRDSHRDSPRDSTPDTRPDLFDDSHVKFGRQEESVSDGIWADRREERGFRIRKRAPTGHPGLAQKLLAQQSLEESDEDSSSVSGMEPQTKTRKPSKDSKINVNEPSKKKAVKVKEAVDTSDSEWDKRKVERVKRINRRAATGHPGLAQKLLAQQSLEESDEDSSSVSGMEPQTKTRKPSKDSKVNVNEPSKKKAVKVKEAVDTSDSEWDKRKEERVKRINRRAATGHPGLAKKLLAQQSLEESDEDSSSVSGMEPQTKTRKPSKDSKVNVNEPSKKKAVKVKEAVDTSDSEWDKRKEERVKRINRRAATGHPGLAKKLLAKQALEESDGDSSSVPEMKVPIFEDPPQTDARRQSKGSRVSMRESSKKKKAVKVKETVVASDSDWDKRKEERVKRINRRAPTGHPGLAKKLLARQLTEETDASVDPPKLSKKKAVKVKEAVDTSDSDWDKRKEERVKRINKRAPTGHPGLAKKLLALEESDEDSTNVPEMKVPIFEDPPQTDARRPSRGSKVSMTESSKNKKAVKVKETVVASDSDWDKRKEERVKRINRRSPTGHPGLAKKLLARQLTEETDAASVDPPKLSKKKAVKVKEAIDTSDSDWDKRKEERVKRINKRAPTGHPGLAKKLLAKQALEESDEDSTNVPEMKVPIFEDPQTDARRQSKGSKVSMTESSKKKKAVKVKETVVASDSDWDKRKEERVKRINKRAPTGHPGLAKKLLAKQALEESDEDSAEQIPTTKAARIQEASQRVSKSSSSKPKKAVKVKEAVDTSDSDWDKRKEERVKRINKRAPTGHPGLAKKLLAKQTLEVDEQPRRKLQFTTVDSHEVRRNEATHAV